MPIKIDNQIKGLLWFLFAPEDSSEMRKIMADRHLVFRSLVPVDVLPETLKSAVWISVSILLSLTLARLH